MRNSGRRWHHVFRSPFTIRRGAFLVWEERRGSPGRRDSVMTRFLMVAALVGLTSACALRAPDIADLKMNPGRYQDRSVRVEGIVTSSWGAPLLPFKLYKVDDGTGEVTVVSQGRFTPARGARVRVKGRVEEVAVFGGQAIGLHLREEHLDVRR